MNILIQNDSDLSRWPRKRVQELFEHVARHTGIPSESELSVLFTNDERMKQLNTQYRNTEETTDVLAFALLESPDEPFHPERVTGMFRAYSATQDPPLQLGDILISVDRARQQAEDAGNCIDSEIALLLIHGLLHLIGYNDIMEEDKQKMWGAQEELLQSTCSIWNPSFSPPVKGE